MTQFASVLIQDIPRRGPAEARPELLHDFVAALAETAPARTALEDGIATVSYFELDRRAGRIANLLISQGIQSGNVVAVRQERSADLFASLLGILKAGAAYVTIDPAASTKTVRDVLARSQAQLIMGSVELPAPPDLGVRTVHIEDEREALETLSGQVGFAGRRRPIPHRSASVLPAGGEGVTSVKHRDAVRLVRSLIKLYSLGADHRCHHDAAVAFDVAIEESLAMLAAGATLVLGRPANGSAEALTAFVARERITLLSTTPAVMAEVDGELPSLEVLVLGREVSPSAQIATWGFRVRCLVSLKRAGDRFPSFRIEQETGIASRPRLICARAVQHHAPA